MGLLEGLADADPALRPGRPTAAGLAELRAAVETATRKSELRVVEDQVDAVVCAYVALFTASARPDDTTTYGDLETGYIVTPTAARPGSTPEPTAPPTPASTRPRRPGARVRRPSTRRWVAAGEQFLALVTAILDDAGINYLSVTGRTKTVASFAEKAGAHPRRRTPLHRPAHARSPTPIGIRVITYVHSDVSAVADLLHDQVVVHDDRDMGRETAQEGRFGYASRHLLIGLDAAREGHAGVRADARAQRPGADPHRAAARVGGVRARHPLQGHDARRARARLRPPVHPGGRAARARRPGVLHDPRHPARLGVEPSRPTAPPDDDPRIDPRELAAFLAGQYAEAGWSRTDHYAWISGLLLELGITSLDELGDVLRAATRTGSATGWTTATRPAPYAASTTRCSRRTGRRTSRCAATPTAAPR